MTRYGFTFLNVALVIGLALLKQGVSEASPSVSFTSPSVNPTSVFNVTQKAVCQTPSVTVQATVAASFDAAGTCVKPSGARALATGTGTMVVTASDGTNTATLSPSGGVYSGTLPVVADGPATVTFTATASDGLTATPCSPPSTAQNASANASAKYVSDQVAPSLIIQSYSPGPSGGSSIPRIQQGQSISVHVQLKDGSSGTPVAIKTSASSAGSPDLGPFEDDLTFAGPNGSNDNGKAPPKNDVIALNTTCATPPGIYTMMVEADPQDLCGNSFAPLIDDPAATHDGASGNDKSGTFEILANAATGLQDTVGVLSEFPTGDYGVDQCFTSALARKKVVSNPGTVHIDTIISADNGCGDGGGGATISNVQITLNLPNGFKYYRTGASPLAHIFIGAPNLTPAPGFDLHSGTPLVEVTDAVIITQVSSTVATLDLSNVDVGLGAGVVPAGDTIFTRAHAIWASTTVPAGADQTLTFANSATADSDQGPLSASSSYGIVSNPSVGCIDGLLASP